MHDWFFRHGGRKRLIDWLGVDAWIDSSLAETWQSLADRWNGVTTFFARFRLTGWRKLANEAASEGLTMGAGGLFVLYVLAIPALTEFDANRISTGKYSVKFLDRNGAEIGQRGIHHNDAIPLDDLPDHLIKATLATEDRRFFEHFGVDFLGTARALIANAQANEVVQGGSTLTQQLAKNLFLSAERSIERKVKEAYLAFLLESRFTKREILKLYLDRAYMGGGAFGVEAAAQFYFGKSARELTLAESALMAGLFKAPSKYAPHINLPAARARTNEVLSNMVEAGYMSAGQVHAARLNPAKIIETRRAYSPDWFMDWAFEEIQRIMKQLKRTDSVLTAQTTVDLIMQRAADTAVQTAVQTMGRAGRFKQAALVAVETDGAVRTIVGGIDYADSGFNRATHGKRQAGSSFKPYVYLAALEAGYKPTSAVVDKPYYCGFNHWVKNYSGGNSGRMPLTTALARSINTVAVWLSNDIKRKSVSSVLARAGISKQHESCTMALGDGGLTLLEHTAGFAHFASGGLSVTPYAITQITNTTGEVLFDLTRDQPARRQVFERAKVEQLNQMLRAVVTEGTGRAADLDFTISAGKTGTTSSHRDAWFLGFTGKLVAGVWFGNDDNRPMGQVTGGHGPAPVWRNFMTAIYASPEIPAIPGLDLHPNQVAALAQLEQLRQSDPTYGRKIETKGNTMPAQTRAALKRIATALKRAASNAGEGAFGNQKAGAGTQAGLEAGPDGQTSAE